MNPFTEFKKKLINFGLEYFHLYYGTYRGFVADNEDPEAWGRVKLKVPTIYGDKIYDYWAWPVGMYSGKNVGFYAIPNVGDMVWVRYENGNPDYPIWEYGHWNKNFKTPSEAKSPKQKVFQSTSGLQMLFDDQEEKMFFGKDKKANEPAVLGTSNEKALNEIIEKLEKVASTLVEFGTTSGIASTSGPTAPLSPSLTKLTADSQALLTAVQAIKNLPEKTKSKIVTLE